MKQITPKQNRILLVLLENSPLASSAIYQKLTKSQEKISLVTVKRELSKMAALGLLTVSGVGPATQYQPSVLGRLLADINARSYCAVEPDSRFGQSKYNFDFWPSFPVEIFLPDELSALSSATNEYKKRTANLSAAIQKKELERLVIELSWKSSKIEGNTYSLLDTEKLILEHKEAPGHSKKEAWMILNHKEAFAFAHSHLGFFKKLTRANLDQLHAILVKDLSIGLGFRKKPVGILGSKYRPPDNIHQISDAVTALARVINRLKSPYAKALTALLGISYIQPFEDGNKRTSRLMANALLMAHGLSPLSYRSVDENEYREAMLVFYELNSLVAFKQIFINQYEFAARNYTAR